MALKPTNHAFFHLDFLEKMLALALLGNEDPDPGVQLKKIMKEVTGAFVVNYVQQKVREQNRSVANSMLL